ncbi:MAG: hypothetical protein ACUVT7_06585 [Thermoplasmata archaeon]
MKPSWDARNPYKLRKRIVDGAWDLMVRIKYPKLALLGAVAVTAFLLFKEESMQAFFHRLGDLGYLSAFFGGSLFAFGFGAPFGVAILVTIANDVNIVIAAIVGGIGALSSDYLLFKFIRMTFSDEIHRLKSSVPFRVVDGYFFRKLPAKISFYLSMGIAGMVIASPLPDEIGVVMLAGLAAVSDRAFAVLSFALNTMGIFFVLAVGSVV